MTKNLVIVILLALLIATSGSMASSSGAQFTTSFESTTIGVTDNVEKISLDVKDTDMTTRYIDNEEPISLNISVTNLNESKTAERQYNYEVPEDGKISINRNIKLSEFDSTDFPLDRRTELEVEFAVNHPSFEEQVRKNTVSIVDGVDNTSCNTIKQTNADATSGVYSIQPENAGSSFDVYCDMEYDGGGWTLVMKSSGSDDEFRYNSNYWTSSSNTLNDNSVNLDTTVPTKLNSYNTVVGDEIRAEFPDHQNHQMVESFNSEKTPHSIFTTSREIGFESDGSGSVPCGTNAGIGRFGDYWYNFDGETNINNADSIFAHQCGRQQYGFNISTGFDAYTGTKVRWGWNWQNEADTWESQDAVAGIGLVKDATSGVVSSDGVYSTTIGSQVYCCSNKAGDRDNGDGEYPRDVLIWIR